MKKLFSSIILFIVLTYTASANEITSSDQQPADNPVRIVVAGGSLAELVYALGAGDQVVGVDQTVTYPPETDKLPKIGYWRQLNTEGILSLKPTLFMTWQDAGPEIVFKQLENSAAHVKVSLFKRVPGSTQQFIDNIHQVAEILGRQAQGEQLATQIETRLNSVAEQVEKQPKRARVLFLLSMGGSPAQVAGKNSSADSVLRLAGAENVAEHHGYKIFSPEAFIEAAPDIIVVTSESLENNGLDKLAATPGVIYTPAWKNKRIVSVPQAIILGIGPRVADAVDLLYQGFYPQS